MSESLIMVQLTCPLSQSHKPDVQRLQLSGPTVFLYVYSSGAQVVKYKARVISQTNENQ